MKKTKTIWRDETQRLLNKQVMTKELKVIANEAGIGYTWLCMFHSGKIKNPSVNIINTLHDYLVKQ